MLSGKYPQPNKNDYLFFSFIDKLVEEISLKKSLKDNVRLHLFAIWDATRYQTIFLTVRNLRIADYIFSM